MDDELLSHIFQEHHINSIPVDVDSFLSGDLVAMGTPEEIGCAILLLFRSWKQRPPASLPDDDKVLALLSGAKSRWEKVKDIALTGFEKVGDRLVHFELRCSAEKIAEEILKKEKFRKKDAERKKLERQKEKIFSNDNVHEINESLEIDVSSLLPETERNFSLSSVGIENSVTPGKRKKRKKGQAGSDDESFNFFWSIYPKRSDIVGSERAWKKLTEEEKAAAISDVQKRIAEKCPAWEEKSFIPMPSTYLNRKRWLDEWRGERKSDRKMPENTQDYFQGISDGGKF